MKVLVTLVAEVDLPKWRAEYGDVRDDTPDEVRDAIKEFAVEATRRAVAHLPVKVNLAYVPSGRMGAGR